MTRAWRRFLQFLKARDGLATLELAISMPFLIAMLLGSVEVTRYVLIAQKLEKISFTLSDIVAQSTNTTTAQLNVIAGAAAQIMNPYTFNTNGYIIISSVTKTGSSAPVVSWQYGGGGTWTQASRVGQVNKTANIPGNFTMVDKDNVIFAEVFYNYQPLLAGVIFSNKTIYKMNLFKPRLGTLSTLSSLPFWLENAGLL